ncbi:hypothetical protein COOONC_06381 [Cooperia oncophora]
MEIDPAPPVQPIVMPPFPIAENESVWKPDIIKDDKKNSLESRKRKTDVLDAMSKERYLLMKNRTARPGGFPIPKEGTHSKTRLASVQAFIEERFFMHFGPTMDSSMRKWSEEEEEEQQFLIDNSLFIVKVILRMNNLNPDNYKSQIENFHAMAKSKILFQQTELRDKELDSMKSRLDMARRQ